MAKWTMEDLDREMGSSKSNAWTMEDLDREISSAKDIAPSPSQKSNASYGGIFPQNYKGETFSTDYTPKPITMASPTSKPTIAPTNTIPSAVVALTKSKATPTKMSDNSGTIDSYDNYYNKLPWYKKLFADAPITQQQEQGRKVAEMENNPLMKFDPGGNIISGAKGLINAGYKGLTGKELFQKSEFEKAKQQREAELYAQKSTGGKFADDVVKGLGSMAAGALTGNPTFNLVTMGTMSAGQNTQQALDEGASPAAAVLHGIITGTSEALTEKMFGWIPGGKMFEEGLTGLTGNAGKNALKVAGNFLKKSAGEGIEEAIMDPITQASSKFTYGKDISMNPMNPETYGENGLFPLKQMGYDALLGATIGGITGAGQIPGDIAQSRAAAKEISNNIQRDLYVGYSMPQDTVSHQTALNLMNKGRNTTIEEYQDFVKTLRTEISQYNNQQQSLQLTEEPLTQTSQNIKPFAPNEYYKPITEQELQQLRTPQQPMLNQTNPQLTEQPLRASNIPKGESILPEQNKPITEQNTAGNFEQNANIPKGEPWKEVFGQTNGENVIKSNDPNFIDNRSFGSVGDRKTKAYQYEHPEFKPWYQDYAKYILDNEFIRAKPGWDGEIERSMQGEVLHKLKDVGSYDDIKAGLEAIIKDNGAENIASAKRVELVIDDMLTNGFKSREGNYSNPASDYIQLKRDIAEIKVLEGNSKNAPAEANPQQTNANVTDTNVAKTNDKHQPGTKIKSPNGTIYTVQGSEGINYIVENGSGKRSNFQKSVIDSKYSVVEGKDINVPTNNEATKPAENLKQDNPKLEESKIDETTSKPKVTLEENKSPEMTKKLDELKDIFPETKTEEAPKTELETKVDKLDEKLDSIIGALSGKIKEKDGVNNDRVDENSRGSNEGRKTEASQEAYDVGGTKAISGTKRGSSGEDIRASDSSNEAKPSGGLKENGSDGAIVPNNSDSERISNERTYDVSQHGAGNYKITADDVLVEGGKETRFKNNIAAIKLVNKLEEEGRRATPEEQKVLIKYVGWGGIKEAFSEKVIYENGKATFVSDKKGWDKKYSELKEVLSKEDYKTAQTSMSSAHYTKPELINSMYDIARHLGFKSGKILEPAAGIGHFIGLLPSDMSNSSFFSIEKDNITSKIAKYLYPDSKVRNSGFENVKIPNDYFDMAISNVPFGDMWISDGVYSNYIHNFFFSKSLDKVKEGGLLVFITSTGTLDTSEDSFRQHISDRADLVGAFRLPNDTFKENAGTEVTTDLIILRKRLKGEMPKGESFKGSAETNVKIKVSDNVYKNGEVNEYFINNPDNVLGKFVVDKLTGSRLGVESTGDTLAKLREGISKLPQDIFNATKIKTEEDIPEEVNKSKVKGKNNSYIVKDGRVFKVVDGELTAVEEKDKAKAEKVKSLVALKGIANELIELQTSTANEVDLTELQKKLNKSYDEFVKKHGYVNENVKLIKDDPEVYRLIGLEMALPLDDSDTKAKQKYKKADIFTKRVVTPYFRATSANNAKEALAIVVYEDGLVDIGRIAKLAGITEGEAKNQLQGMVYENPQGGWELESEYLSGNVKDKLIRARQAAEIDSRYDENVRALEKAQPVIKPFGKFKVSLGAAWIPVDDMKTILADILDTKSLSISHSGVSGKWEVKVNSWGVEVQNYAIGNFNAGDVITKALNSDKVQVFSRAMVDGKEVKSLDVEKTNIAKTKIKELEQKFLNYINQDIDMQKKLETAYNDRVNIFVERTFNKQDKQYIGMSREIALRPHQVQATERTVYGGNVLLAHDVGFGKTFIMLTAAMELKRLGVAKKPLIIMPNNKLTDFRNDMLLLYPQAKILAAEQSDFEPSNIKALFARIATNDWDCIMIRHSSFEAIPVSAELEEEHYESMIRDLRIALTEAKQTGDKKYSQSDIQKKIDKYIEKIANIREKAANSKYNVVTFEEMGIDYLFVDEAHEYKNLEFPTSKSDVKGVNSKGAGKANDLYIKTKYITSLHGGKKGLVFATGTPVSNALNEMYTMFKYLRPDILEATGTTSFDAWVSMFGQIVSKAEVKTGGQMDMVERFRGFFNLKELMKMYKEFADMKYNASELGLKLPELENGKPTIVECEPHPDYEDYVQNVILKRIDNLPKKRVKEKGDDNHLAIASDTAKATLDMRLVNRGAKDFEGSKVNRVLKLAMKEYKDSNDYKGTQLIFIDKGASEKTTGFDTSVEIVNKLVKAGVPRNEIALAKKFTTEAQMQKLFADVNSGKIRFLIGTYEKMSTGLNVQERLVAIHEVNAPWKPSQILQAEGRMIRQKNLHEKWGKKVRIYRYAVTSRTSYDAIKWQVIETKIVAINKLTKGEDIDSIEAEEDEADSAVKDIMMIKAKALNDDRFVRQIELQAELPEIEAARNNYYAENNRYKRIIKDNPEVIKMHQSNIAKVEKDIQEMSKYPDNVMEIMVEGKKYKQNKSDKFEKDQASPKKLAGEAIAKAVDKAYLKRGSTKIGEFKGLSLYGHFEKAGITFSNNYDKYDGINITDLATPEGIIDRITRETSKLEEYISWREETVATLKKDIETANKKVTDKPFPKEEEYQSKRKEKDLIEMELENNVPLYESKTEYRKEKPTLDDIEAKLDANVNENASKSILLKNEGFIGKKQKKRGSLEFINDEVGERFDDSKKIKTNLSDKVVARLEEFKKDTTRGRFRELERGATYSELRNRLLNFTKGKDIALYRTLKNLQGIVAKMDARDYEYFNAKVVFMDLLEDAKEGKLLPFGLKDEAMVQEELDNINRQIGTNDVVEEAMSLRGELWEALKDKYKAVAKSVGLNANDKFKKQNYFRHLVIEHVQKDRLLTGTGQKLKTPRGSGFLKMRHGYEGDIVSDYLQAEAEVMAQMSFDIERMKLIKYVDDSEHNIIKPLTTKAKAMNEELMEAVYNSEASDGMGGIMLDDKGRRASDTEKLMRKYTSFIAMSYGKLSALAKDDKLWKGDNGEYTKVVNSLASGIRSAGEESKTFKYISELGKTNNDGVIQARTILKYTQLKKSTVKETLGDNFKTWEKLIPDTHVEWQATEGNALYTTYSIPEHLASQLVNDMIANTVVDKSQLQKILTKGLPHKQMVLPREVVETLNNLTNDNLKGIQSGIIMNSWKQWQLIMPRRLVKYNLRNITGDIDKVFLGNPEATTKIPRAMKELFSVMYGNESMSPDMKDWFERGGMSSFLQVNEMGDINELKIFLNTANGRSLNFIKGYWKQARLATDYREAILRYASYLSFKEQIDKNGRPKNYGGSIVSEINALRDSKDKAYQLSNELLGAYDDISPVGQKLRARPIPFFSFSEVNMKTYSRAVRNIFEDSDKMAALGRAAVVGGKKLPFMVARNTGRFILGATFFTALLSIWNNLFFKDEEDDIPEGDKKRAHLILGRDPDGKPIYETRLGSLTDALEWFGLGQIDSDLKDVLNGKKTIKEQAIDMAKSPLNKVYSGLYPFIKLGGETLAGVTAYPDMFKMRTIRDRGEYLAQSFGLANEYKAIVGKPSRGYANSIMDFVAYRSDPKETAYYETLDAKRRYKESVTGKKDEGGSYKPSDKSNALYYYKLALRYKDKESTDKYLAEYLALGGTKKGYIESMQQLSPTYGIDNMEAFEKSLDPKEQAKLETAKKFYAELLDSSEFVPGEYTKAYVQFSEIRAANNKLVKKMKDGEVKPEKAALVENAVINKYESALNKLNEAEKVMDKRGMDTTKVEDTKTKLYQAAVKRLLENKD
jgi:N12 class adenine-specific DNA methylase